MLESNDLDQVEALISGVRQKRSARGGTCFFRGEPRRYPLVSSTLFRQCSDSQNEAFDIGRLELEILEQVRDYSTVTDDVEILAELQHFGGKTNLIDFTEDLLIAFFFASADDETTDGRIILHWPDSNKVVKPRGTNNRVVFQKSVLVRPTRGFIVPDDRDEVVVVPARLKEKVLSYLTQFHGIAEESVFNDIHGYIRYQNPNRTSCVEEFRKSRKDSDRSSDVDLDTVLEEKRVVGYTVFRALHWHQRRMAFVERKGAESLYGIEVKNDDGSTLPHRMLLNPDEVVKLFSFRIENEERRDVRTRALCLRSEAYLFLDDFDRAEMDIEAAIDLDDASAHAYRCRAHLRFEREQYDDAISDIDKALQLRTIGPAIQVDRGFMKLRIGDLDDALSEFTKAVNLSRDEYFENLGRDAHFYRAVVRCVKNEWGEAIADFKAARCARLLIASSFQNVFGGIDEFELKHGVRIPSSIRTELFIPKCTPTH